MLSLAKQGIKQLLHAAGIEAHRFHPGTSPLARSWPLCVLVISTWFLPLSPTRTVKELREGCYSELIVF
jgi:hypothetical protein